jgi:hypothetical protein
MWKYNFLCDDKACIRIRMETSADPKRCKPRIQVDFTCSPFRSTLDGDILLPCEYNKQNVGSRTLHCVFSLQYRSPNVS